MRTRTLVQALSVALLLPALAAAEPVVYKVDTSHSGVNFTVRHFVSNTPGRFKDFGGTIKYDKQNPAASSVEFTVKTASIDTDNDDRDGHLRSPDFFEVEKFPTMTFTSTKVTPKDADTLDVTGNLTIKGTTKQITIPVDVLGTFKTPNGEKAGFETSFVINRKDYGIVWNRVLDAGPVLGEDIKININVEADRVQEKAAK
ncbi:MAG TPA: YceI family protein [Thermoanaerobaculia bacterium]|nr:YceI family protein [Thermoanaerobaculia bacterium]